MFLQEVIMLPVSIMGHNNSHVVQLLMLSEAIGFIWTRTKIIVMVNSIINAENITLVPYTIFATLVQF